MSFRETPQRVTRQPQKRKIQMTAFALLLIKLVKIIIKAISNYYNVKLVIILNQIFSFFLPATRIVSMHSWRNLYSRYFNTQLLGKLNE